MFRSNPSKPEPTRANPGPSQTRPCSRGHPSRERPHRPGAESGQTPTPDRACVPADRQTWPPPATTAHPEGTPPSIAQRDTHSPDSIVRAPALRKPRNAQREPTEPDDTALGRAHSACVTKSLVSRMEPVIINFKLGWFLFSFGFTQPISTMASSTSSACPTPASSPL